jgi:5-formyltetrahydrofolate cyclo-ligase
MTKDAIRHKVWTRVTVAGVTRFPSAYGRIPNFTGAERAAALLRELTIWKRAKVIKVEACAPQLSVRRAALRDGKIVYLALPGLRSERCFLELDPERLGPRAWRAASLRGALQLGRPVAPQEMRAIDLLMVGAVAVTRQGARVGKGSGATDLEYGVLRQAGRVREYTPIVTTLHPLQLIDDRIPMRAHDIPVDFLITPDHVVAAPSLYPRPRGILWDLLAEDRIRSVPVLRKTRRSARGSISPRQL